jgi:hypothetical protein|tara:strand:- start:560 stop:817 length:258 start_codon:yes stop_codon:yes gene_type:complete
MKRELDEMDLNLNFIALAIKMFDSIGDQVSKDISPIDLNRLARLALAIQKSVKSIKIPKTDKTMMRNINSLAKLMEAHEELKKKN